MKTLLLILMLQHAVIAARAGLVTYVWRVDAQVDTLIGRGQTVRGDRGGRFEAMLAPDTYLRLRDDAEVVLEDDALDHTVIRVVRGPIVIDAHNIDDEIPIRILVSDLEFEIAKDGLYLFEAARMVVLDGETRVTNTGSAGAIQQSALTRERIQRGSGMIREEGTGAMVVTRIDDVEAVEALPLVRWSRQRTEQLTPTPTFQRRNTGRRFRF